MCPAITTDSGKLAITRPAGQGWRPPAVGAGRTYTSIAVVDATARREATHVELELRRLDHDEIELALAELEGWQLVDGKLTREYVFADFVAAIGFMVRVAIWAEVLNHHPEWSNLYRVVTVELVTHDVDGVSPLDVALAHKMNELATS
jgi:4a-hydroxytetrahydrobiopterin dehydratase